MQSWQNSAAPLLVVVQSDNEIAALWPNLVVMAQAHQNVTLLLHGEAAGNRPTIEWVSDGTRFEASGKIALSFSIEGVARACAAIYPKCRRLSVYATVGQLLCVLEMVPESERSIVVVTKRSLGIVAAKNYTHE